jgi:hypothetical protein
MTASRTPTPLPTSPPAKRYVLTPAAWELLRVVHGALSHARETGAGWSHGSVIAAWVDLNQIVNSVSEEKEP